MVDLSSSLCERLPLKITIYSEFSPMKIGGLPEANPMLPVDRSPKFFSRRLRNVSARSPGIGARAPSLGSPGAGCKEV